MSTGPGPSGASEGAGRPAGRPAGEATRSVSTSHVVPVFSLRVSGFLSMLYIRPVPTFSEKNQLVAVVIRF